MGVGSWDMERKGLMGCRQEREGREEKRGDRRERERDGRREIIIVER